MKKVVLGVMLALVASSASADWMWHNGYKVDTTYVCSADSGDVPDEIFTEVNWKPENFSINGGAWITYDVNPWNVANSIKWNQDDINQVWGWDTTNAGRTGHIYLWERIGHCDTDVHS